MLALKIIYDLVRERDSSPEQHLPYNVKNAINGPWEHMQRGNSTFVGLDQNQDLWL